MRSWKHLAVCICLAAALSACSISQVAIRAVSDALTAPGSSTVFTGDDDPLLVAGALPFAIKLYETLLAANPEHQGLLLTTGSLFVMYANAFVQRPAETLDYEFFDEREAGLARAKKLYTRGCTMLLQALELKYPGFGAAMATEDFPAFLERAKKEDVPLLYWSVAGLLSAYSLDVFDFNLSAQIVPAGAMMARAYALDPDYSRGTIDEFYILYYGSLPEMLGGDKDLALKHFNLALEKSGGLSAGPYVSYAQTICIPERDYEGYVANLNKALAVDPDAEPSLRLMNILARQKAQYLLEHSDNYF